MTTEELVPDERDKRLRADTDMIAMTAVTCGRYELRARRIQGRAHLEGPFWDDGFDITGRSVVDHAIDVLATTDRSVKDYKQAMDAPKDQRDDR